MRYPEDEEYRGVVRVGGDLEDRVGSFYARMDRTSEASGEPDTGIEGIPDRPDAGAAQWEIAHAINEVRGVRPDVLDLEMQRVEANDDLFVDHLNGSGPDRYYPPR